MAILNELAEHDGAHEIRNSSGRNLIVQAAAAVCQWQYLGQGAT